MNDQTGGRAGRHHQKDTVFYEEQGLLNVERAENGYREYHTADIARLQEIKLFRKMDISIEEMRALLKRGKACSFVWNSTWENWNAAGRAL